MAIRTVITTGKKVNGIVFDTLSNGQMEYESNWKGGDLDRIKKILD
jgi:antitoxin component YwqK of YwqJK toxin-antitoxin module